MGRAGRTGRTPTVGSWEQTGGEAAEQAVMRDSPGSRLSETAVGEGREQEPRETAAAGGCEGQPRQRPATGS
jgi:hypothetical protein